MSLKSEKKYSATPTFEMENSGNLPYEAIQMVFNSGYFVCDRLSLRDVRFQQAYHLSGLQKAQ